MYTEFWPENMKGQILEDQGVDGRIIKVDHQETVRRRGLLNSYDSGYVQWWAFVKTVINLQMASNTGNFRTV
jgi:hypothetical protein